MSELICNHKWGHTISSGYAGGVDIKICGRCEERWISDGDKGFEHEPRVVLGRIE